MPLFDHFHGPIAWRPWESFHSRWACAIADDLNRRLPKRLVAESPMDLVQSQVTSCASVRRLLP